MVSDGLSDEYGSWNTTWISLASAAARWRPSVSDLPAVEADLPAGDRCQAEDPPAERGLARAGLADQADGLAGHGCRAKRP